MQPDRLGTAQWADPEEFARQHAYQPGKFWLGRCPWTGRALGYSDDRHICLVSGSRAGKGTTTIIPNLCLWP
ncbi:MAG: type IV secretory system conjugative DNA transfer family protein, partial [Phycisphaerales bacterium]|nr:type IV secretory system conjugative DNA transfer family protein [Phycisphaerales bacterium]